MPFGSEGLEDQVGLALSGGGFRATLFHIGALRRLLELGILTRVGRVSSISGGSIAAGRLAQEWKALAASPTVETFEARIGRPLRAFCSRSVDTAAILHGALSPFSTAGDALEKAYAGDLLDIGLHDLPDSPVFVLNATNLQTGRSFRFMKAYMGDYRIGLVRRPTLPLARAVAASSAFPPLFAPIVLEDPGKFEAVAGADLNGDPDYTRRLYLADGGVYDNLGLETVWNRCGTVLASDAGSPFSLDVEVKTDAVHKTLRALDVATDQSRGLRKRMLVGDYERGERKGGYWGIDTKIGAYKIADALPCKDEHVLKLANIRTRLDAFSAQEQGELVNWGYALCDAAIRRHAPHLAAAGAPPPQWPEPDWRLDR